MNHKYSIETLYHFNCNCGQWWSIADYDGELDDGLHCPRCGEWRLMEEIKNEQIRQTRNT